MGNKRRVVKVQIDKTQFLGDWISVFDLQANISVDNLSKNIRARYQAKNLGKFQRRFSEQEVEIDQLYMNIFSSASLTVSFVCCY